MSLKFLDEPFQNFAHAKTPLNGSKLWVNEHMFKGERRKSTECHRLKR